MSSTRYANPGNNPDESPERYLASGKLRGISIGMNIVTRVAHVLSEPERAAMIWLTNYAHLRDLTADALCTELQMEKAEIRSALTDPEADRKRFILRVEELRSKFEASLPGLANTVILRKVRNAVKFGASTPQIIEIIGKTRIGKSESGKAEFLRRMDRAAWLHTPKGQNREFIFELARSLGIAVGSTSLKAAQIVPKIIACFGPNRINMLFVDEGHRLWPHDLRTDPYRIDFLRDLWELHGVTVIVLATPQYSESMSAAMQDNPRWAPGQWDGRVQRFHLPDTMSDEDLGKVARYHFPDATDDIVHQLVDQAKASEGFCGAMVKAIERAKFMAAVEEKPVSLNYIKLAQKELAKGTRLQQIAEGQVVRRAA